MAIKDEHGTQISALNAIVQLLCGITPPPGGLATESTLISVLNAIIATQDVETLLVRDTGNGDLVIKQVTSYSTGSPVTTYEDVDGNAYVPVGPLVYLDPSAVLNLVLAELITLNATDFATETTLAALLGTDFSTETTLAALLTAFNSEDFATETTLAALLLAFNNEDFASEATLALLEGKDFATETTLAALAATDFATETTLATLAGTDFATETTLASLDTYIQGFDFATEATLANIETLLTGTARTGVTSVDIVAGSSTAGIKSVSFWFRGNNGTLAGNTMPNGTRVTYTADGNDTLNAIAFTPPTTGPSEIIRIELA